MKRLSALILVLLAGACARETGPATVQVADAWCRAAPASAPAAGCYLTLTASGRDRLVAVETPAAREGQIHSMSVDGGVMRMRQLEDGLALPKGVPVALKPGGLHLMIIGPKAELKAGGAIPLILRFEKAPAVSIEAPIRARAAAPAGSAAPAPAHDMGEHH